MKSTLYKFSIAISGFFILSLPSCKLEEANENPNATTDVSVNVLLPATQANLVWAVNDFAAQSTSTLVQYLSGTLNVQYNVTTYDYLPANFQTTWNRHFYGGAMVDNSTIIEKSGEEGAMHYRGIAKIQQAIALGYLVDLWGDVPYSTALNIETARNPTFESGEALYEEVFKLLDEGIVDLNSESTFSPAINDLIYPESNEGNWRSNSLPKWIKASNALKARYHNHLSKIDPEGSALKALDAIEAGTFTSNDEEMKVVFGNTSDAAGPWFGFLLGTFGQNNISISQEFIDFLQDRIEPGVDDPRLRFYVEPNEDGTFLGTPYGMPMVPNVSRLGVYVNSEEAPTNMITYSEVKFIEAEANFRLNNFHEAAEAFNEAVEASLLRVTGEVNPEYLSVYASEDASSIQINGMRKIFTEKYIDMFLQTEAWTDWRRSIPPDAEGTVSGIPLLAPASDNGTNGVYPRRFLYPPSELDNNAANIPATSLTDRVFWDK